jgi:endonuclease/exonuclease/phosphatase family metal-dependent hydrolase
LNGAWNAFYIQNQERLIEGTSGMELTVMSFNIRYDNPEDGPNQWRCRKDAVAAVIQQENIDAAGTQEVLVNQRNDLLERLPGYGVIGVGRDDGKEAGEFSAIFYRQSRLEVIESGNFWLSKTPDIPGVKGWDASNVRIATWALFEHRTGGRRFFFLNTHLDHIGPKAQRGGVELLLKKTALLSRGFPVILTGDFNLPPGHEVIRFITNPANQVPLINTNDAAEDAAPSPGTFHDFGRVPQRTVIDYIFAGPAFSVLSYRVLPDTLEGVFLSDHTPILARLRTA